MVMIVQGKPELTSEPELGHMTVTRRDIRFILLSRETIACDIWTLLFFATVLVECILDLIPKLSYGHKWKQNHSLFIPLGD
jgi:hypothetical protein